MYHTEYDTNFFVLIKILLRLDYIHSLYIKETVCLVQSSIIRDLIKNVSFY